MKPEFKRDMNHNYLILPVESHSYQLRMFCSNEIAGLLKGRISYREGEEKICYDISSKQNMVRMYDRSSLTFSDLKELFHSWKAAAEQAERFLMNPCFLSCDPELLYMNPSTRVAEWLFFPTEEEITVPSDLEKLSDFLMEKVDHRDPMAMDVVYRFFKEVKSGTFLLPEIVDYVENSATQKEGGKWGKAEESTPAADFEPESEFANASISVSSASYSTSYASDSRTIKPASREGPGGGLLEKVSQLLPESFAQKLFGRKSVKERIPGPEGKWGDTSIGFEEWCGREDAGNSEETAGMWMAPPAENEEDTVLIGVVGEEKRQLHCMQNGQDYSLCNLPVVVGKLRKEVDICLEDPSVSRMHARFFEREGKICLEDLNSKNGCSVNEMKLENNETVELYPGDRITIGGVAFLYS